MPTCQRALLVIDIQNDYFPGGAFELANAEATLQQIEQAAASARSQQIPVILVQHIADPAKGLSPFFNQDTHGVALHPRITAAAPDAAIVVKRFADSFHQTGLGELLQQWQVKELLVCGMMTQNCVTHTALSQAAAPYEVSILTDCCTTVSPMLHAIALNALTSRSDIRLQSWQQALA
ncbi:MULTISPECIES: cysteine hydrolase family protein [unclassified Paludibacterium]|uniref:cysteine hydrolase family protein n=1 Tax=unclassified Paludibacterium TaxID=2618429 RepID=UPI001C0446C8|nr:cysteine hydrolase family protein [Paludibacterium sp. B53371]BEV71061.1 cysteine hydrolase family protein [Paludibacterium sp. THUN1379]